jgi:hypothetical protein
MTLKHLLFKIFNSNYFYYKKNYNKNYIMKINLINYSFFILIILLLLKLIQNLYFERKFLINENFDNKETYKLINLDQSNKGDSFSNNFDINPNIINKHISTPMEIENKEII